MRRIVCVLLLLALAACQPGGDEFVGDWQSIEQPASRYRVQRADPVMFQVNDARGKRYYAVFMNGRLTAVRGFSMDPITYMAGADRLEIRGAQYKRMGTSTGRRGAHRPAG